jgi:hypothetical protein
MCMGIYSLSLFTHYHSLTALTYSHIFTDTSQLNISLNITPSKSRYFIKSVVHLKWWCKGSTIRLFPYALQKSARSNLDKISDTILFG